MVDPAVTAYVRAVPPKTRPLFNRLRTIIRQVAPDADERMSYGILTFVLGGNLVHLGAYPEHVGLYGGKALPKTHPLSKHQTGKGTLRFVRGERLPVHEVMELVRERVAENLERAAGRKKRK